MFKNATSGYLLFHTLRLAFRKLHFCTFCSPHTQALLIGAHGDTIAAHADTIAAQAATIATQKEAIDAHELTIASHATMLADLSAKMAILLVEASATTTTRTSVS